MCIDQYLMHPLIGIDMRTVQIIVLSFLVLCRDKVSPIYIFFNPEKAQLHLLQTWFSRGCSTNPFVTESSFVEISSEHLHSQTIRARKLKL